MREFLVSVCEVEPLNERWALAALVAVLLSFGLLLALHVLFRTPKGEVDPGLLESCHRGYDWEDVAKVFARTKPDALLQYRDRRIAFDKLFAMSFAAAGSLTGLMILLNPCGLRGERWLAFALIILSIGSAIIDWLEGSLLARLIDRFRSEGGQVMASLKDVVEKASRRTVLKFVFYAPALLLLLWFHLTWWLPGAFAEILTFAVGVLGGYLYGRPNPRVPRVREEPKTA